MNKKAQEKGLQMVFTVFVLVIITGVIIMLFLKTVKVPKIKCNQNQKIESAIMDCQSACNAMNDFEGRAAINGAIEFCSKTETIDYNCDGMVKGENMSYGSFISCEDRVPCFELVSCGDYDGAKCKELLKQEAPQKYNVIAYKNISGDCGLSNTSSNWVYAYNFTK